MAARTLVVTTPTLSGASISSVSAVLASSDTVLISVTTAQSSLDFKSLHVRAQNTNSITTVVLTLAAGTKFSSIGAGTKSITIATGDSIMIGGQDFESARFLNFTAGTILLTATGTGPTSIEAYQAPKVGE